MNFLYLSAGSSKTSMSPDGKEQYKIVICFFLVASIITFA